MWGRQRDSDGFRIGAVGRCIPALLLLLLGYLTIYLVQVTDFSFTGKPTRDFAWIIGITQLAVYLWIRLAARIDFWRQIQALSLLYGVQICLYLAVRIDGFMGDGRPIWVWRWSPSVTRDWSDRQPAGTWDSPPAADLANTSPYDSPGFRGSGRAGVMTTVDLARTWSDPPTEIWRQSVGQGWSSFAVVGEYCVTQEQRGSMETVVCYALSTGREIWSHADEVYFNEITGGGGPRATPTIHAGNVYSLGATGILNCLDGHDGTCIWSTDILADHQVENALFGMSGSPLIVDHLVVVSPGGRQGSLAAYDLNSGTLVWTGGDAGASYSSPQLAVFPEGRQILSFNAEGLYSHHVETGEVLWSYPWVSNPAERNNVCQPVPLPGDTSHASRVFISSGYGMGCALFEIGLQGSVWEVRPRWQNRNLKAKFSSVVVHAGYVYGLDNRILVCIDLATGERQWRGGRYGFGQLVATNNLLVVQEESGDVVLVELTPQQHRERGRFAALDDRTWNHPVVTGDKLLVRNDREAACYRLPTSD